MTEIYSKKKINEYLNALASVEPVPGGGSAAALAGAIGAALLSKVANFTIGKERYKKVEGEIKGILKQSEKIQKRLFDLCSEDAVAYKKLSDVFKLPKSEKHAKKIQGALKEAIAIPFEICKNSHAAMKLCVPLAKKGNANLITDVGDGSLMLKAAFEAAVLNVGINLKSIKDKKFSALIRKIIGSMKNAVYSIEKEVIKQVEEYLSKNKSV